MQNLTSGQEGVITITGRISPNLTSNTNVINTATLTGTGDITPSNNTASAGFTVNVPTLAFSQGAYTVAENAGQAVITISLSAAPFAPITVNYSSSDNTAIAGSDYTASSGTATVITGTTSATFTVPITDDLLNETSKTLTLTLSSPVGAALTTPNPVSLTITDNDPLPSLTISDVVVDESNGTAVFTVSLSTVSGQAVKVDYATRNGTATAGSDYIAIPTTTLTIPAGDLTKTFIVTISDDLLDEADETFNVNLANPVNAIFADNLGVGTITDNDTAGMTITPSGGLPDLTISEPSGSATFNIHLTSQPTDPVTIDLIVSDPGECGVSPDQVTLDSVTWQAGVTVTVTTVDDFVTDGSQPCNLVTAAAISSDSHYAGRNPADVTVTVNDDDVPGIRVSPTAGLTTTETGGTATFTVRLGSQPTAPVTITLTSSNSTEGTVSPALLIFTDTTWHISQTVTTTGVDDDIDDSDQSYTILTNPANSGDGVYDGFDPTDVSLVNLDDDTAGFDLTPTSLTVSEPNGTASFSLSLRSQPTATVTVTLISSDSGECLVASPVLLTALNWQNGLSVTVIAINDLDIDGDQPCILSGVFSSSDGNYNTQTFNNLAVTVKDDELPVLYLPLIFKDFVTGPDLVIDSLSSGSSRPEVVIRNAGNVPVTDAFWVDVYFNPTEIPSLNKIWPMIAPAGAVWGVKQSLAPGETLTLTVGGMYYDIGRSSASFPTGAQVYGLVDSVNLISNYGGVLESNEGNNLAGPVVSTAEAGSSEGGRRINHHLGQGWTTSQRGEIARENLAR